MTRLPVCTVVLLPFLLLPLCASDDRLVVGKALSPGDVIVSDPGTFALGFFSPSNSTPTKLYLGIWFDGIPKLTVVWVADREEAPISIDTGRRSSSEPTFALTNTSNPVLSEAEGRVVWATNLQVAAMTASSSASGTAATLTSAGNLVLRSPNGITMWQSFDHPTYTFLPTMKFRLNHGYRRGDRLVSSKSSVDPSPGDFTFGADPTFLQTFIWNGSRPLWRSVWNGYQVLSEYVAYTGAIVYYTFVDVEEDAYMAFSLSDGASPTRHVMSYSGRMELQSWNNVSMDWDTVGASPGLVCSRYGYCGPFGYCDRTDDLPANRDEWSNGRFSQGFQRREALRCGGDGDGDGDGFLPLPDMKAPDRFLLVGNKSFNECAAECRRNCSCVAYAYANFSGSSRWNFTRCLLWAGELIDMEKIGGDAGSEMLLNDLIIQQHLCI